MTTTRPVITGSFGVVASTHWIATATGMSILERGGNAFDAAVATGLALQVLEPHMNGPAGDLVVMIEVKDDDRFERQGDDLITDLTLTLSQAVLGGRFGIPTATVEEEVDVPAGVQPETVLRLRGRGLPRLGHGGRGDVLVRVHVYVPESVSAEQEELFRRLAQVESQPPRRSSGFWSKLKEALGA